MARLRFTVRSAGSTCAPLTALAVAAAIAFALPAAAEDERRAPCTEDAMIVFDASGSMAGNLAEGIGAIDKVREALGRSLPYITLHRRVGLVSYGPGPNRKCNVDLHLRPIANATQPIMSRVHKLNPAGNTPLAEAVERAADVLDYTKKPGVVVVLTDGEETCGGAPCALGKRLRAQSAGLTVHVIGFRMTELRTGGQSALDVRCLAKVTGGLYIGANTPDELAKALKKTLACPLMSAGPGAR